MPEILLTLVLQFQTSKISAWTGKGKHKKSENPPHSEDFFFEKENNDHFISFLDER